MTAFSSVSNTVYCQVISIKKYMQKHDENNVDDYGDEGNNINLYHDCTAADDDGDNNDETSINYNN